MSKLVKEGHNGHFGIFLNELNAKIPNSVIFSNRKETKTWENGENRQ